LSHVGAYNLQFRLSFGHISLLLYIANHLFFSISFGCHYSNQPLRSIFSDWLSSRRLCGQHNMAQPTLMTRAEGDAILREIRESKGVDDPNGQHYDNVQDLSNALNM
jgi:hypothetical protein